MKPCAQIYAVTVQISEVKMPQISRKNPGEHPAEGHIEIYGLRLLGMRARGCRWGLWSFQTNTMQNLDKYIVNNLDKIETLGMSARDFWQ